MKRPFTLWLLMGLLLFLSLGGLYGGITMLADPSGGALQMTEMLPRLRVPNFIWPGLFLLVVMGLTPLLLIYGLWTRRGAETLPRWAGRNWAWAGTLALCAVLAVWLFAQAVLIGFQWPIQYITALNGILIAVFALTPGVKNYCQ